MKLNILLILGNGYDLNLELPTDYKSFLKNLKSNIAAYENNKLIKFIIAKAEENNNWVDIEVLIGKYYKEELNKENIEEVKKMHKDYHELCDALVQYLKVYAKHKLIGGQTDWQNRFFTDIVNLSNSVGQKYKENLDNLYSNKGTIEVEVLSLNYTKSFNSIFPEKNKKNSIKINSDIIVNPALSLHGDFSGIVFGVDSLEQLGEDDFSEIPDLGILQTYLIKEKCNEDVIEENYERRFVNMLKTSHLVILYGVSLGQTDNRIWKKISDWINIKPENMLLIHRHGVNHGDKGIDKIAVKEKFGEERSSQIMTAYKNIFSK